MQYSGLASRLRFARGNDADCRSGSTLIKSASHERHRNCGADRSPSTL